MGKQGKILRDYCMILLGGLLYALSTVLFIFPHGLLLGGTSGISVILEAFLPFSPGTILLAINTVLLIVAFIILGKQMALRTFVGSTVATVMITLTEQIVQLQAPVIPIPWLSALTGAAIIAVASGVMFYVDSSSGGTDIVALIVRKYSSIDIGKALLLTDFLIVVAGGILSGWTIGLSSMAGLLVKTLGIDFVISLIKRGRKNA
jgi:uncharacterized membrane-anchored protein YitT (DUF2179 family)